MNRKLKRTLSIETNCQNLNHYRRKRGSYTSANVLLNLLRLRKRDKNVRRAKHFISFCSKFNKFNNTGERMLDNIYSSFKDA